MEPADCDPGADAFIERHFNDCVYNTRDYLGFTCGLAAILLWVVAQLPQFYNNYVRKSADVLSPWFLAQWLLGDTFNLLGCLLQGQQLPTTTYTAMYFVVSDVVMMMQYIYYGAVQKRRERILRLQAAMRHRRHHHHHHHRRRNSGGASGSRHQSSQHKQRRSPPAVSSPEPSEIGSQPPLQHAPSLLAKPVTMLMGVGALAMLASVALLVPATGGVGGWGASSSRRVMLHSPFAAEHALGSPLHSAAASAAPSGGLGSGSSSSGRHWPPREDPLDPPETDYMVLAGTCLGWVSSVLYLMSRVSQIRQNARRQDTEGLAMAMFVSAASANLCTGTGILLRTFSWQELEEQAPWLVGSLGTIMLDMIILSQSFKYGSGKHHPHARTPDAQRAPAARHARHSSDGAAPPGASDEDSDADVEQPLLLSGSARQAD